MKTTFSPKPLCFLMSIIGLCATHSFAQSSVRYGSEKAYLHTDRLDYAAGDTVWYKAYVVEGKAHTLKSLSQVLYVSLLDCRGNSVSLQQVRLQNGTAAGQLALPDSLSQTFYQLVAYTNWMRNEATDFFFRKNIQVWSKLSLEPTVAKTATKDQTIDLQFFPEGGDLVAGLSSRVAFKAVATNGLGIEVAGRITDEKGDLITEFKSQHLGMGVFSLTPAHGKQYVAEVSVAGQLQRFNLPKIVEKGYVMTVDNALNKKSIRVEITSNEPTEGELHVFAHARGELCFEARLDAKKNKHALVIPRENINQQGIVHLTLFDAKSAPRSERLFFVYPPNQGNLLSLSPVKSGDSVMVEIELDASATESEETELSVAVATNLANPDVANIQSYLLLNSDLKGHIEQPNFYFDSKNKKAPLFLDNLLMTQGWRRFDWQAVRTNPNQQAKFAVEQSLKLSGKVLGLTGKPLAKAKIQLLFKSSTFFFPANIITDKNGHFVIEDTNMEGEYTVTAQTQDGKEAQVVFDAALPVSLPCLPPTNTVEELANKSGQEKEQIQNTLQWQRLLTQANGGVMLGEVEIKAKKPDPRKNDARRLLYGGNPDRFIEMDDAAASLFAGQSILKLVSSRVPSVALVPTNKEGEVEVGGDYNVSIRGREGILMIDGIQVSPSMVSSLNPFEIEMIDVLTDQAGVMGVSGGGGVVNFLTKRGVNGVKSNRNQAKSIKIMGYAVSRSFYAPNFANSSESVNAIAPPMLYWNPSVKVKNRKVAVKFTIPRNTSYTVVAEGVSSSGIPLTNTVLLNMKP